MAVDKTFLLDLSPEFETVDSGRIDRLVLLAAEQVPAAVWGAKADLAVALLVAHWLTVGANSGKGAITSEQLGDLKRTFSAGSSSKGGSSWDATPWGAQYKALGRMLLRGPLVT